MKRSLVLAVLSVAASSCGPPATTDPCKGRKAGDVVITELMIDPDGTDTGGEWIELFNALGSPLEMKGLTLTVRDGSGTTKTHVLRAGTAQARGSFTAGDVRSGPNPAWISYSYDADLGSLPNSSATVGVRCGTTVIDEVTYTVAPKAGRSRALTGALGGTPVDPDATANDDEARWCDTPASVVYGGANAGTPGAANPECRPEASLGTCVDPTSGGLRPMAAPAEGQLIITEVLANPSVREATQEWVEVYALADVDLNDVTLSSATGSDTLTSAQCLRLSAGEYGLLARSADPFVNGELPPPMATTTLSLANTNERLTLSRGDAGIDMAAITSSANGVAWQLDPALLNAAANDDPANFCHATTRWADGGDLGTPGAPNPACPPRDGGAPDGGPPDSGSPDGGDPNLCWDVGLSADRAIVRPILGDVVVTEIMADPVAVPDTSGEWFEVLFKATADLNGLTLANEGAGSTTLPQGPCLRVAAGTSALFARSADPLLNGGLPPVTATFNFDLVNSALGGAAQSRFVRVSSQGLEFDRLAYPLGAGSVIAGASVQLDGGLTDAAANDGLANLCNTPTSARFVLPDGGLGERGTPGAPNVPCP